jgi:hypothetical protein
LWFSFEVADTSVKYSYKYYACKFSVLLGCHEKKLEGHFCPSCQVDVQDSGFSCYALLCVEYSNLQGDFTLFKKDLFSIMPQLSSLETIQDEDGDLVDSIVDLLPVMGKAHFNGKRMEAITLKNVQ